MSLVPVSERVHPLHSFTGRLHQVLDGIGSPATWTMTASEMTETITELATAVSRLQGMFLGLVADADRTDLAAETGQVNTAALVRALTRVPGREATKAVKFSRALEQHSRSKEALATGAVTLDQAREIVTAIDALPASIPETEVARAEAHLLEAAAVHDAAELKRLGTHLAEVIDPEHADQLQADRLVKEEARAARRTFLESYDCGDGTVEGRYRIPAFHHAMLDRCLGGLLNPNRPDPIDLQTQSRAEARGQAFCQLLERINPNKLPKTGGMTATVVVMIPLDTLLGGLKAAQLDTGQLLSPTMARKLACQAGVIPAVLGSDGAVLDLGTKVRFHDEKQRLAMLNQQGGKCAVEGCDRPGWLCDGAHLIAHTDGGHTSVEDGGMVCPRHHTMADSPKYSIQRLGPGRIQLIRRQ